MPTISMFYGIIITMYTDKREHNPPHFHARYAEYKCKVDINKCEIIAGHFPSRQIKLVTAWAELHKESLIANWKIASHGENPFVIQPLL